MQSQYLTEFMELGFLGIGIALFRNLCLIAYMIWLDFASLCW